MGDGEEEEYKKLWLNQKKKKNPPPELAQMEAQLTAMTPARQRAVLLGLIDVRVTFFFEGHCDVLSVQKFQPADNLFSHRGAQSSPPQPHAPMWFLRLLRSTYESTMLDFVRTQILSRLEDSYKEWRGVLETCAELCVSILSRIAMERVRELSADWREVVAKFVACTVATIESLCARFISMLPERVKASMPVLADYILSKAKLFLQNLMQRFQQMMIDKIIVALHADLSILIGDDASHIPLALLPTPKPLQIIQSLYVVRIVC